MKTPFANFFKRVLGKPISLEHKVNKPAEEVKAEKLTKNPPRKGHDVYIPYTSNDAQAKIRDHRKIRARMQKRSRIINR